MFKPFYALAYGTLMRAYGNHRILSSTSEFIGEAVTIPDCYTMLTGGFPYVLKNGISHVKGELYLIKDEETSARLDSLEGVPSHYVRHETQVQLGNVGWPNEVDGIYDCIMYVASPRTELGLKDHPNYVKERTVVPNDDNVLAWPGPYSYQTAKSA
jgi:gamma-glutamylcyclotransferase (GGCT)/AIG2-like uncharacterized protein YtfP